jgi:transcriptional regulator with XRE-family HTH domain
MIVGDRLKAIPETKDLSQGDIEKRTGLLRCYISRVENGHTVPSIETLEKMARALEIPMYQLFYDGNKEPQALKMPTAKMTKLSGKDARVLSRLGALLGQMKDRDKTLLVGVARKMSAAR